MSKIGCLIIHGFGGNTDEVAELGQYFTKRGLMVICPSLKGHTGNKKEMAGSTYKDWLESAENDLIKLMKKCNKIILIGFSMGGLLAVQLANKYKVLGVATLNTPIYYWDFKIVVSNIIKDIKNKKRDNIKRYKTSIFGLPIRSLINFRILLHKTKPLLNEIRAPFFIAQGMLDDTVHFKSADYIFKEVSSPLKHLKYYKNSPHLICKGPDCEQLAEDLKSFIGDICNYKTRLKTSGKKVSPNFNKKTG